MNWQGPVTALCVVATFAYQATSYNLADKLPLFKFGPIQSKFGFSVALHKLNEASERDASNVYLMAGAPTAKSEDSMNMTGGVYYCPVTTDPNDCTRVNIDIKDGDEDGVRYITENQWLGVTLKSEGPAKNLVSCAHRYTRINLAGYGTASETSKVRMCGHCVLLTGSSSGNIAQIDGSSYLADPCKDKPLKTTWTSKKYYGYPQTGVSIALDSDQYFLGAPGTYSYTGAVFHVNGESMERSPTCEYGSKERIQLPNGRRQCKKIPVSMDSYLGFSITTSKAIDNGSSTAYVISGAPRGNETGAVLFFTEETKGNLVPDITKSLFGEKISSSFGYSVAATDLNNDGLDDLIVGAPQYFERSGSRTADGAVYVYMNEAGREFGSLQPVKYYGSMESFFGHSVAALGDVDQDGYNDFAVGSPSEDGIGAVYIFRGGPNTPIRSQVIRGSEYDQFMTDSSRVMKGFGSSLSTLMDVDGNKYPDLLVGSLSDNMVLIRSRPVITLAAELIIYEDEIDLDNKTCSVGNVEYSCFGISFCFSYSSHTSAEFADGVNVKYTLLIDNILQRRGLGPRVHFGTPEGNATVTNYVRINTPNTRQCLEGNTLVYIGNNINDKLTPIELEFEFDTDEPEANMPTPGEPISDMSNYPILDGDSDRAKKSIIPIKNSCGDDGCQSNLRVEANMTDEIVLGKDNEITVTVQISNDGEDAHQANTDIYLPENIDLLDSNVDSDQEIDCISYRSGVTSYIKCDLGNPFPAGSNATITLKLSTATVSQDTRSVIVSVEAHTTSQNPTILPLSLKANVLVEVDLELSQEAQPQQLRYKESLIIGERAMEDVEKIGPELTYTFTVLNKGTARSSGINVVVDVPVAIFNRKWLLYLVSADVRSQDGLVGGSCNSSYLNPAGINVPTIGSRTKRDAENDPGAPKALLSRKGGSLVTTVRFTCDDRNAMCVPLECYLDTIEPTSFSYITVQLYLWKATLLEEYRNYDLVYIETGGRLTTKDAGIRFKGDSISSKLTTTVDHDEFGSETTSAFPWWYILIFIIILILFYVLIIVALMKIGFLKRKRFPKDEDDEPISDDEKKLELY